MVTALDDVILAALNGKGEGAGVLEFSSAESAIAKAEQALKVVHREGRIQGGPRSSASGELTVQSWSSF